MITVMCRRTDLSPVSSIVLLFLTAVPTMSFTGPRGGQREPRGRPGETALNDALSSTTKMATAANRSRDPLKNQVSWRRCSELSRSWTHSRAFLGRWRVDLVQWIGLKAGAREAMCRTYR